MKIFFYPEWSSPEVSIAYVLEMAAIQDPYTAFFEDRSYGRGCKAIDFGLFCVNLNKFPDFVDFEEYKSRTRKIMCVIEMNFEKSTACRDRREFATYISHRFMEKAEAFRALGIKDFDINSFINDSRTFFADYLRMHKDGELPLTHPTDGKYISDV